MKKILLYVHELTYSGSPYSTLRLARALKEIGYNVVVWSLKDGLFKKEYEHNNIRIEVVLAKELRLPQIIRKFKQFDLLIANSILTGKAVDAISNYIPTVWYIREAHNIPDFFEKDYKRGHLLKSSDNVWVVSEYAQDYVNKFFNNKTHVVHNCVDDVWERYSDFSRNNQRIKIIMIGTIESRKNFLLYVDAYNRLKFDEQKKLEIHIVGRKIESEQIYYKKVLEAAEKSENIIFHGEIQDRDRLMELIAGMNVVAVISKDESCSLTALEGAMMGKSLVLSENIGAKYLLSYSNGWLIETNNVGALTKTFSEMVQCGIESLYEMGQRSRKAYLETSTFDIYKRNLKEAITKYGFQNKQKYYYKNFMRRNVWYVDETELYYEYPDWGYKDEQHHIYSFDIFDTIITRDVAKPEGIFLVMQEKMKNNEKYREIPQYIIDNFVQLRIGAEGLARQSFCVNGIEDKTLEEIYQALCMTGKIDENIADKLMQLEVETEYEHSVGVLCIIEQIKQMIADGKRVILISDMYLDAQTIRTLLKKHDDIFEKITIYVSSECKKMKGTTHLFKYVQNLERVSFRNWSHVGDNDNADVKVPLSLGIQAKKFSKADLMEYEKEVMTEMPLSLNVQLQIGLSRKLRVSAVEQLSEYEVIGGSIGGSLILPYICWVIISAAKMECRKVFFFQDNVLAKKVADIVISALGYTLMTDVLLGSENLWNYLVSNKINSKKQLVSQLEEMINNGTVNVEVLMKFLEISEAEIEDLIPVRILEHLRQFPHCLKNVFKWAAISEEGQGFIYSKWIKKKQSLLQNEKNAIVCMDSVYIENYKLYGLKNESYIFFTLSSKHEGQTIQTDNKCIRRFATYNKNCASDMRALYLYGINNDELSAEQKKEVREYEKGVIKFTEEFVKSVYLSKFITNTELFKRYSNCVANVCPVGVRKFIKEYMHLAPKAIGDVDETEDVTITYGLNNTLITRDLASKEGVFLLMKKKILDEGLMNPVEVEEFITIRRGLEYNSGNIWKISLDQIYNEILSFGKFQLSIVKLIEKIELQIEEEHAHGIAKNIMDVSLSCTMGRRVILICNSYFSAKFIRMLLAKEDVIFEDIPIYVTCECSEAEMSEDVFQYIHDLEKIDYKKWYHIGSDLTFDVNRPQKLGIQTIRTELAKLMPYESAALKEFENSIIVQYVVGLSKILRINKQLTEQEILGCFGGAMLYGYVQWLIDDAINRGYEKLLFIARDGYVLKLIADIIIYNYGFKIKTEYIYGSRKAWRMPSYSADDDLSIFFKMAHINQLRTIKEWSEIFGIPYEELERYIPQKYRDTDYILKNDDYQILRDCLEAQSDFKKYLEIQACKKKELAVGYIRQVMADEKCAFVELSGTGATQNCLTKIISSLNIHPVSTYFLNLDSMNMEENTRFINYLPNNSTMIYIIENLCRAVHGQTVGYEIVNNKFQPIIETSQEGKALIEHGYLSYFVGVLYYTEAFSKQNYLTVAEKEQPIIFQKYLRHLTFNPCPSLLDFIADMPFEATGNKNELRYFAPHLTERQIKQIFFERDGESIDSFYFGACLDYSIKRMSQEERKMIDYYRNLIPTKEGQKIRMKKRIKEKGYLYTFKFACRRFVRNIFLQIGIIDYKK